ncbi:AraC family transcriptional regulator [Chitinophaga polysaccharea]|nr:AraC family transcriptional regulator [Chitinophaga polysaccharea]
MKYKTSTFNTEGGQVVAFPKHVLAECRRLPLIKHLFINRMGHFPNAVNHYYSREARKYSYAVFLHCYDGEGWIKVGTKKFTLKAGDAFFFPPYIAHSYAASAERPWSIFWMHLSGKNVEELMEAVGLNTQRAPIHTVHSEERVKLFHQMLNTLTKGFSVPNLLYANLVLPNYLGTFISPDSFTNLSPASTIDNNYINTAIIYMQQHIDEQLSVEVIARELGISSTVLFRNFKKSTGYSPIAYFNFLKTQKAIQLIHARKYTISEIGSKIGIDDPYYFSRLFKKQMGVSPRQYINEFLYQTGKGEQQ